MDINGKVRNSIHAVPKTPEPMVTKFGRGDDVEDHYHVQNFIAIRLRVFAPFLSIRTGAYKVTRLVFWGYGVLAKP